MIVRTMLCLLLVTAFSCLWAAGAALKAAGNHQVTVRELPRFNHLFQTADTGSPREYGEIQETIAPVAFKTIGDWLAGWATADARPPLALHPGETD